MGWCKSDTEQNTCLDPVANGCAGKALASLLAVDLRRQQETEVALRFLSHNTDLRALIVTCGGEKAFVAGADIAEMANITSQEER